MPLAMTGSKLKTIESKTNHCYNKIKKNCLYQFTNCISRHPALCALSFLSQDGGRAMKIWMGDRIKAFRKEEGTGEGKTYAYKYSSLSELCHSRRKCSIIHNLSIYFGKNLSSKQTQSDLFILLLSKQLFGKH